MRLTSDRAFRLASWILAAVLGLQSIWLLLADLSRPELNHLPADQDAATAAAKGRNDATWAAWIGIVRGDLWADAAFTFANLLWEEPSPETSKLSNDARYRLVRALSYAPHQSGAWLLMAGLSSRYQWPEIEPMEALRVSYYTAPSDMALLPLRLLTAVRLGALSDPDLQQSVRRDLRLLVAQHQGSVITEAYGQSTPEGQKFIEQVLKDIDPAYPGLLRAGAARQN